MTGVSFTEELARSLDACEALLESMHGCDEPHLRRAVVGALVGPVAAGRELLAIAPGPPELTHTACRLCRDLAQRADEELAPFADRVDLSPLRRLAAACDELL
jgi:hypothetical protein